MTCSACFIRPIRSLLPFPRLTDMMQIGHADQKTRSAFITGPDHLGIEALPSDTDGMPSQFPLPRMITAQCDIVLTNYLSELLRELFGDANGPLLRRLLTANTSNTHIAYVALRIIAEGTVWVLVDKERRDQQNNINVCLPRLYTLPSSSLY